MPALSLSTPIFPRTERDSTQAHPVMQVKEHKGERELDQRSRAIRA